MAEMFPLDTPILDLCSAEKKIQNYESVKCAGLTYTVDDAVNRVGYGRFQFLVTFLAGFGWIADSFEIIILSLIGELVACDWPLLVWQNALLTSVVFCGIMIGSPVFGVIADIYGRKRSLGISATLLFLFGVVTAASPSFTWMVVLRTCMGFALGGVAQGLTLCSEYCPINMRGKAGFYLSYFWALGTVGVILMTWVIMDYLDNWRILLAAASIPALVVTLLIKWYPESARYYLVSNQYDNAKKILEKMANMNGINLPSGNLICVPECSRRGRIKDLFVPEYRKTTLLFWFIWLAVSFAYFGIAFISPIIIQKGGLGLTKNENNQSESFWGNMDVMVPCVKYTQSNYIDLLWTSAAEFPGIIIFTFLIESINRKVLLSVTCGISGILIFLLLVQTEHKFMILLFLFGARAIIAAVFQLVFIMTSESFPTTLRAIAMGSGSSCARLGGLMVPYVAQVLVIQYPWIAIFLLGGCILLASVAAACLPLETRGVHMKEILESKR